MLSDRRQRVLSALIEEYVAYALPVGSRTLIERHPLGVSSATVRNELSHLEEEGYVMQPHTSSGRIPTDAGYRAFVDELVATGLPARDARYEEAVGQLASSATVLDDLLERVSLEVSRFTDCLSVVLAPTVLEFKIKQITLVQLTDYRFLVIVVTEDGRVLNRQVDYPGKVPSDDLARVQLFLNQIMTGRTVEDVERGLCTGLREAMRDPLVSRVVTELLLCVREDASAPRTHALGMSTLLPKPEFAQPQSIIPVMHMLKDDAFLLEVLAPSGVSPDGTAVTIGSENQSSLLSGVSVVSRRFGEGAQAGVVAVIGPTRMDYSRAIAAVRAASDALSERSSYNE